MKQQLALLQADMRAEPGSILQRCAEHVRKLVKVYKDHLAARYENSHGGPCAVPTAGKSQHLTESAADNV